MEHCENKTSSDYTQQRGQKYEEKRDHVNPKDHNNRWNIAKTRLRVAALISDVTSNMMRKRNFIRRKNKQWNIAKKRLRLAPLIKDEHNKKR